MNRSQTWGEHAAIVAETYGGKKEWQKITGNRPSERRKRRTLDVQRRDLSGRVCFAYLWLNTVWNFPIIFALAYGM